LAIAVTNQLPISLFKPFNNDQIYLSICRLVLTLIDLLFPSLQIFNRLFGGGFGYCYFRQNCQ